MWSPTQTWLKSQNSHRGDERRLSGIGWGLRYITAPWLAYSGPAPEEVHSTLAWHSYSTVQLVMLHQICIKCQRKNPILCVSLAELLKCYAELKRSVDSFVLCIFSCRQMVSFSTVMEQMSGAAALTETIWPTFDPQMPQTARASVLTSQKRCYLYEAYC